MTKAPFVFEHTTKNSPLEGVTITAGAQAAVRQPSTPASGRGEALEGGDSCAIPPPFQRREVGVRTSHTTAAQRLSSTLHNALQEVAWRRSGHFVSAPDTHSGRLADVQSILRRQGGQIRVPSQCHQQALSVKMERLYCALSGVWIAPSCPGSSNARPRAVIM